MNKKLIVSVGANDKAKQRELRSMEISCERKLDVN